MSVYRSKMQPDEAAALRAAMRDSIRNDFDSQYQPKPEIPQELMDLLMQIDSTKAELSISTINQRTTLLARGGSAQKAKRPRLTDDPRALRDELIVATNSEAYGLQLGRFAAAAQLVPSPRPEPEAPPVPLVPKFPEEPSVLPAAEVPAVPRCEGIASPSAP